jgi:predicted LPLAT superfamily acyltransferase
MRDLGIMKSTTPQQPSDWRGRPERGTHGALRLIVWLAVHAGRRVCRVLVIPICTYFFLTAPRVRGVSRQFLQRALGRPAGWRDVWRNLHVFATTLLDRVYLLHDQSALRVEVQNEDALRAALAQGRGCLLLGSHLGSFEMLGVTGAMRCNVNVNVVMHVDDSTPLREALSAQGAPPYAVIPLGQPDSMLRVKECLERGEVVGILADRVYGEERSRMVEFLGFPARFSLSPFRLAAITGAPALSAFALFEGGNRYHIRFEALSVDGMHPEALQQAYVRRLDEMARRAPYNWFNFYDYWKP